MTYARAHKSVRRNNTIDDFYIQYRITGELINIQWERIFVSYRPQNNILRTFYSQIIDRCVKWIFGSKAIKVIMYRENYN